MTEQDVIEILDKIFGRGAGIGPDTELLESGLLDSLGTVLLLNELEDRGIEIQLTRVEKSALATPRRIAKLTESFMKNS